MPEPKNLEGHEPVRAVKRALRGKWLAAGGMLAGLALVPLQVSANASLQPGQSWSGTYRCGAISGRATVEVTRFEPIADRPGWQRIEATLTIEENGRRGVARFAGNNPTPGGTPPFTKNDRLREAQLAANNRPERFLLVLKDWVEQPAGVEVQRLQLQPMFDAGGAARLGVNALGRRECIVNGADTFAFVGERARPDRLAVAAGGGGQQAPAAVQRPTSRSRACDELRRRVERFELQAADAQRRMDYCIALRTGQVRKSPEIVGLEAQRVCPQAEASLAQVREQDGSYRQDFAEWAQCEVRAENEQQAQQREREAQQQRYEQTGVRPDDKR